MAVLHQWEYLTPPPCLDADSADWGSPTPCSHETDAGGMAEMSYPAPKVPLQNLDAKAMPSCLAREADALPSVSRRDNESNNATGGLCRLPDLGSGETFCRFGVVAFKR